MKERIFQVEMTTMKEETKSIKMGSNCTVSSAPSTGVGFARSGTRARPPSLAARWGDTWNPGRLEVQGWVTDWSQRHLTGISDDEVKVVFEEIENLMPSDVKQWTNWAQTKESQGLWPRKTMVSLWFVHGTGNMMMIEIFKVMKTKVENKNYEVNGEDVKVNLEVSPQKKPLSRAHAMFCKAFNEAIRDKSKIKSIWGALQVSYFAGVGPMGNRSLAAKYTMEGEGHVQEGKFFQIF